MSDLSKNKIKWIRSLHQKKIREEEGLYCVEGEKMVLEAIAYAGDSIQLILHTTEFKFSHPSADSCCVSEKELAQISTLKTPNKAFAILRKKEISDFSEHVVR